MEISIREGDYLTVTASVRDDAACEDAMVAALDILSRVYGQQAVIRAYGNVDPDGMCIRE